MILKLKHVFKSRVDPFSKKDWYDVKAPAMFNIRNIGKTLVTRTQGTSEYLILRCFSSIETLVYLGLLSVLWWDI